MAILETFVERLRTGTFKKEFFDANLTNIQDSLPDGLPAEIIESFVDVILSRKIRVTFSTRLVGCLIPEDKVDNSTVDKIVLWIISYHKKESVSVLNALLRWLIGVLEYGIVDKTYVDSYYNLIWGLITNEKLEKFISHLLYLLTRPEDIYRGRVQTLLRLHEQNGRARHTMALMSLFKSYRPEHVPESVKIKNLQGTFKLLPPTFENYLKKAQDRIHNQDSAQSRTNQKCMWSRPSVKQKIVPDTAYVHLGSDRYHEQKKKIIQCLDKRTLFICQHSLEMPSRVLSLLLNEGGIHLLATHNHDVHVRLSYVLYYTLYRVFVDKKVTVPERECEYFLKQLVDLEDYMQQGIPVVSRFLKEYIFSWDGFEFREPIYRLMERVTFESYEELEAQILYYLNILFITGSIEEQCLIIRTLKTLITNMARRKRSVVNQERQVNFVGVDPLDAVDVDSVIPQLTDFVAKMCRKGLQVSNSHPLLLVACVHFYQGVSKVEDIDSSWSIIPKACVYRCLFSPSISVLSLTCSLLLEYYETYSKLKQHRKQNLYNEEKLMLEEYSADMFNCLVRDVAVSKSYQGYILENLPLNMLCNGDETFSVTNSITIRSLVHHFGEDALQTVLSTFHSRFPGLSDYLELISGKIGV